MKAKLKLGVVVVAFLLASCIDPYDSNSVVQLASDPRIIGVWQDLEAGSEFGLRFAEDERFYTYFLGEFILQGTYVAKWGSVLELNYYDCSTVEECHVQLGYSLTNDTLVITSSQGDIRFKRIGYQ
jgi:hypothetical protein